MSDAGAFKFPTEDELREAEERHEAERKARYDAGVLAFSDLRVPEDLDRLDPRTYTKLATTNVTMVELTQFRLAVETKFNQIIAAMNEGKV
jgi:hypothetical protein